MLVFLWRRKQNEAAGSKAAEDGVWRYHPAGYLGLGRKKLVCEAPNESRVLEACIFAVGVLTVRGPALAHHGAAAYADEWVEFKQATVTKFAWSNPHTLIDFDVKDKNGKVGILGPTLSPYRCTSRFGFPTSP